MGSQGNEGMEAREGEVVKIEAGKCEKQPVLLRHALFLSLEPISHLSCAALRPLLVDRLTRFPVANAIRWQESELHSTGWPFFNHSTISPLFFASLPLFSLFLSLCLCISLCVCLLGKTGKMMHANRQTE